MKIQEFRVGITVKIKDVGVVEFTTDMMAVLMGNPDTLTGISPIAIREDYILSKGFTEMRTGQTRFKTYEKDDVIIVFDEKNDGRMWLRQHGKDSLKKIKYVHQLQNLYFDLTGNEMI